MARYAVRSEPVRFRFEGELLAACLYLPQLPNPQPGLLFILAGWGLDNQALGMAERLAHVGYVTLAVDAHPGEPERPPAGAQASTRAEAILRTALAWLRARPFIKEGIVGTFGLGQGGALALRLATAAGHVQAAVSIDGDGDLPAADARAPLLVIEADLTRVTPDHTGARQTALSASEMPHEYVSYPLAARGFFDERGPAFRPDDAEDAWSRANKFFYKHLGEPG